MTRVVTRRKRGDTIDFDEDLFVAKLISDDEKLILVASSSWMKFHVIRHVEKLAVEKKVGRYILGLNKLLKSNYIEDNHFLRNYTNKLNWKYEWKRDVWIYIYIHILFLEENEYIFEPSWIRSNTNKTTFCSCLRFPLSEVDRRPYILTATLENSARRSDSEARLQASDRTQCGPASRQTTNNFRPKVDLLTFETRRVTRTQLFYKTWYISKIFNLILEYYRNQEDVNVKYFLEDRF